MKQLAELITERDIKLGNITSDKRDRAIELHLMSDKATLIWLAKGGIM